MLHGVERVVIGGPEAETRAISMREGFSPLEKRVSFAISSLSETSSECNNETDVKGPVISWMSFRGLEVSRIFQNLIEFRNLWF